MLYKKILKSFMEFVAFSVTYFIFLNLYQFFIYYINKKSNRTGRDIEMSDFSINIMDEEKAIVRENMPIAMTSYIFGGLAYMLALLPLTIKKEQIAPKPLAKFLGFCFSRSMMAILIPDILNLFRSRQHHWHIDQTIKFEDSENLEKIYYRPDGTASKVEISGKEYDLNQKFDYRYKTMTGKSFEIEKGILKVKINHHQVSYFVPAVISLVSCSISHLMTKKLNSAFELNIT